MTSDPKKWISQIKRHIEACADIAVDETATEIAEKMRQQTDSRRRQTRSAIGFRKIGFATAQVGIFFSKQYTSRRETATAQNFRSIWRTIRPTAIATFQRRFSQHLTGK